MALRHASLLFVLTATASWTATPATPPGSTTPRPAAANHEAVHYCKRPDETGCVDPIVAALNQFEVECLKRTQPTVSCYDDLRDQVRAGQKKIRALDAQVAALRAYQRAHPRSHQEIAEADRVFDSEFSELRKVPGAVDLTFDLVIERMKDPRYANVPLDMIVRDVASRVARVASAGNEQLAAEVEAARREAAQAHEDATREVNAAYDDAEHAVDAAQAIVQGSASDADMAAALAIINSSATPAISPGAPATAPYAHCTSRRVGEGSYAHVETDCN